MNMHTIFMRQNKVAYMATAVPGHLEKYSEEYTLPLW